MTTKEESDDEMEPAFESVVSGCDVERVVEDRGQAGGHLKTPIRIMTVAAKAIPPVAHLETGCDSDPTGSRP